MKGVSTMIPENDHHKNGEHIEQTKTTASLPSRSQVHRKKKKKSKVKIKFPLIKLLFLFFILLPIGFLCVYAYLQDRPVYKQKSVGSVSIWVDRQLNIPMEKK